MNARIASLGLLLAALAAGCSGGDRGLTITPWDAAAPSDFAVVADVGTSPDLSTLPDLEDTSDLATPPDLAGGPLCTPQQKAARWAAMVQTPIVLPKKAAGIDIAGPNGKGLTRQAAEMINCQSDPMGDLFGDGNQDATWGDNGEVSFEYIPATQILRQLNLWSGYLGILQFKSPDGLDSYQLSIEVQIKKDGKPFPLHWNDVNLFPAESDELYRALIATFAPQIPQEAPGTTCLSTKKCTKGVFGDVGYFYVPAVGFALWVDNVNAAQPVPSIPTRFDLF
jgi:hypothetical protein